MDEWIKKNSKFERKKQTDVTGTPRLMMSSKPGENACFERGFVQPGESFGADGFLPSHRKMGIGSGDDFLRRLHALLLRAHS